MLLNKVYGRKFVLTFCTLGLGCSVYILYLYLIKQKTSGTSVDRKLQMASASLECKHPYTIPRPSSNVLCLQWGIGMISNSSGRHLHLNTDAELITLEVEYELRREGGGGDDVVGDFESISSDFKMLFWDKYRNRALNIKVERMLLMIMMMMIGQHK